MSLIARSCCALVHASAHMRPLPRAFDAAVTRISLALVDFYRRHLSRYSGRTCLFEPSCSNRAQGLLRQHGFSRGIGLVSAQLRRCGAGYSLCVTCSGETLLFTCDGEVFPDAEVSPRIKSTRAAKSC